jgi:membrane dipeptidase
LTDDPDRIGSNQALAYLGLEGAFLLNEGADEVPPDEAALDRMLKRLKAAGLSYVGLTWSNSNVYAGVAGESSGLSARGRVLVRLLIRNGLLIDLSHASDQTVLDLFHLTKGQYPLFFSHSSVRSLCEHPRNLSDSLLDRVRESGGLAGVNFHSVYVSCSATADREDVFRHLDYLKRRIGAEHTAFGSDFDGLIKLPEGLTHPADLVALARRMIHAGYSRSEIENIYFRNVQRVLKRVQSAREADFFASDAH